MSYEGFFLLIYDTSASSFSPSSLMLLINAGQVVLFFCGQIYQFLLLRFPSSVS